MTTDHHYKVYEKNGAFYIENKDFFYFTDSSKHKTLQLMELCRQIVHLERLIPDHPNPSFDLEPLANLKATVESTIRIYRTLEEKVKV